MYSQTWLRRPLMGPKKSGRFRQVVVLSGWPLFDPSHPSCPFHFPNPPYTCPSRGTAALIVGIGSKFVDSWYDHFQISLVIFVFGRGRISGCFMGLNIYIIKRAFLFVCLFVRQNDFLLVLYRENVWVILRLRVQIPRGATFYRKGNFLFFNQLFAFRFQIKGRAKHGSKVLGRKKVIMTQKVAKQKQQKQKPLCLPNIGDSLQSCLSFSNQNIWLVWFLNTLYGKFWTTK